MKTVLATVCAMALGLGLASSARSTEPTTLDGRAAFEKLKTLVGEWDAPLPQNEVMTDIFRPIGAGTAILHEEWKNGEQLTATVFYLVGSELHADHYCDYGNQLHYVATPSTSPDVLAFQLRDATNLDSHPRHFHSTTWHFIDTTHLTQDWEVMGSGKPSKSVRMEFTRKSTARSN
jgi:hypothetical protein